MKKVVIIVLCVLLAASVVLGATACSLFGGSSSGSSKNKSVTVTLKANGGEVAFKTLIGKPGDPMELPEATREGCVFDKWYDDFDVIDQTVFPSEDTVLTARYYLEEDSEFTITQTTELNKSYSADTSRSTLYWSEEKLKDEDLENMKYITRNYTEEIRIVMEFEGKCSGAAVSSWLGGHATYYLVGANTLGQKECYNYDNWEKFKINVSVAGSELVNEGDGFLRLRWDASLGSTYALVRNINLTISGVKKKGTLV